MSVTVTITTVKPAGVSFYSEYDPGNTIPAISSINSWSNSQPGLVSQNFSKTDENTYVSTFVFDTIENYTAWHTARNNLPEHQNRRAYNRANNIVTTINEVVS